MSYRSRTLISSEMEKDNRHLLREVEKFRTLLQETEKSNDFLQQKTSMRDEQVYQLQLELQRVGSQNSVAVRGQQMLADITQRQEERREISAERRREVSHGNGTGRGHGGQPYGNHDLGQSRPQSRVRDRAGSKGNGRR